MPDSIREVLQGIAGDEGPSRDLAAGAYRRARTITRRRLAAVAITVVAALAMAGGATAAIIDRDRVETPPVGDPTGDATEAPTDPETTPSEVTPTGSEADDQCTGLEGWSGWGPSDSMAALDALPERLVFLVRQDGHEAMETLVRFDGTTPSNAIDAEPGPAFRMAPDGERFTTSNGGTCDGTLETVGGERVTELEVWTMYCEPSWSPDSNRVLLNRADPENTAYLLDVATGAVSEVAAEVGCSAKWSPDGQFLISADGRAAMRPDGSDRVELAGAAAWTGEPGFIGVSSVSADLSRACLHFEDSESAASSHLDATRCDRYVDTSTGEELEPPVDAENPNVVFLADGSSIWCDDRYGEIVLTLVDGGGNVLDSRTLPGQSSGGTLLRGYYTG